MECVWWLVINYLGLPTLKSNSSFLNGMVKFKATLFSIDSHWCHTWVEFIYFIWGVQLLTQKHTVETAVHVTCTDPLLNGLLSSPWDSGDAPLLKCGLHVLEHADDGWALCEQQSALMVLIWYQHRMRGVVWNSCIQQILCSYLCSCVKLTMNSHSKVCYYLLLLDITVMIATGHFCSFISK